MQDTMHLLNRIGFGPRPGDVEPVRQLGAEKYLDQQLHPDRIDDHLTDAALADLPSIHLSTPDLLAKYPQPKKALAALQLPDRTGGRRPPPQMTMGQQIPQMILV